MTLALEVDADRQEQALNLDGSTTALLKTVLIQPQQYLAFLT